MENLNNYAFMGNITLFALIFGYHRVPSLHDEQNINKNRSIIPNHLTNLNHIPKKEALHLPWFIVSPHEIFIHFQTLLLLLLIKFAVSGLPESPDAAVVSSVGGQRHVRRSRNNYGQLPSTSCSVEQFFIAAAVTACAFAVATGSIYPILLVLPSPFWRTDKVAFRHGILV